MCTTLVDQSNAAEPQAYPQTQAYQGEAQTQAYLAEPQAYATVRQAYPCVAQLHSTSRRRALALRAPAGLRLGFARASRLGGQKQNLLAGHAEALGKAPLRHLLQRRGILRIGHGDQHHLAEPFQVLHEERIRKGQEAERNLGIFCSSVYRPA